MDLADFDPASLRSFDPATATDAAIRQAQEFLGVKVDGDFGDKSKDALKVFLSDGPAVQHPVHQDTPPAAPVAVGGTVDAHSETLIAELHPRVQPLARALILAALAVGIVVRIVSAYRSYAQQTALYAQGRTAPGRKVTNAPAGYSNHNFRSAFDLGWFLPDGRYADDLEGRGVTTGQLSTTYHQLRRAGEKSRSVLGRRLEEHR